MKLRIKNMEHIMVFVHKQPEGIYRHFPHLDAILNPISTHPDLKAQTDVIFDTRKGLTFNVIGVGQNVFKGNLEMEIWIDRDIHTDSSIITPFKNNSTSNNVVGGNQLLKV